MRFIGLDLLKKTPVVCALDCRGKLLFRESVECRREALEAFARTRLKKTDRLAVEAALKDRMFLKALLVRFFLKLLLA